MVKKYRSSLDNPNNRPIGGIPYENFDLAKWDKLWAKNRRARKMAKPKDSGYIVMGGCLAPRSLADRLDVSSMAMRKLKRDFSCFVIGFEALTFSDTLQEYDRAESIYQGLKSISTKYGDAYTKLILRDLKQKYPYLDNPRNLVSLQQVCGEYQHVESRARTPESKLEGTEEIEEGKILGKLFETLRGRGAIYECFGLNIKSYMGAYEKIKDKSISPYENMRSRIGMEAPRMFILSMQHAYSDDKLVNATMGYLKAKYPGQF